MPGLATLIVGVGGTGLIVLQYIKERLLETYANQIPSSVHLLALDTKPPAPSGLPGGLALTTEPSWNGGNTPPRPAEFYLLSPPPVLPGAVPPTLNTRQSARCIVQHSIGEIKAVLRAVEHNWGQVNDYIHKHTRRNIFLVASVAGHTGSGIWLDMAVLLRSCFGDARIIGVIALPSCFAGTLTAQHHLPNSYAALRELDRFMRGHTVATPYKMSVDGTSILLDNMLFDLCYLVDAYNHTGVTRAATADAGALATIADTIVMHVDWHCGQRLNTAYTNVSATYLCPTNSKQSNDGYHYQYQSRRYYSAMNSHTIIFPREDVIRALSLRFLLDMIDTHLIQHVPHVAQPTLSVSTRPVPVDTVVTILSKDNPTAEEKTSTELSDIDIGIFVRTLLQKSGNSTRTYATDMKQVLAWLIEDGQYRKQVEQVIAKSLQVTTRPVVDRNDMHQYVQQVDTWLNTYLGPLKDANNPHGDRSGGEWAKALGDLVTQAHPTMIARIDDLVLRILNQREVQEQGDSKRVSLLRPNRLGYALALLRALKERVRQFEQQTHTSFGKRNIIQARKHLQEARGAVESFTDGWFVRNPGPDYLKTLQELAEMEQQRLLCSLVLQMTQQFGQVLDAAIKELEAWVATLRQVYALLKNIQQNHYEYRSNKYRIRTRTYITDQAEFRVAPQIEEQLYTACQTHFKQGFLGTGATQSIDLGWDLGNEADCKYRLKTGETVYTITQDSSVLQQAWQSCAQQIAADLIHHDQQVRVAGYITHLVDNTQDFVDKFINPHRSPLIRLHSRNPDPQQTEHYLAIDFTSDDRNVTEFHTSLSTGWQECVPSESKVACTYLTLYHGLELEHIASFAQSEAAYRELLRKGENIHLFAEEQHAAAYEARMPHAHCLHPQIVVCLHTPEWVHSFALALVSGLIALQSTEQVPEFFLTLPDSKSLRLSDASKIETYNRMEPTDQVAARLLQAFQTFMLRGHAVGGQNAQHEKIDYTAVPPAFNCWFQTHYPRMTRQDLDALLEAWRSRPLTDGPGVSVLFNGMSNDPRFHDLGMVLLLELSDWVNRQTAAAQQLYDAQNTP